MKTGPRLSLRRGLWLASGLAFAMGALTLERLTRPPPLPSFASVRESYRSSEAELLDRHGRLLQSLRVDYGQRRLAWTPLAAISPALVQTLLAAEDRRFESHPGVDALALLGALRDRLQGRPLRGASTLQMQLAAMLAPPLRPEQRRRDLLEKLRQLRAGLVLGRTWSRDEVIEAYLNRVGFRGELEGIAAASAQLFGKTPAALTRPESRVLVALLRAPSAPADLVATRGCAMPPALDDCAPLRALASAAFARPAAIAATGGLAPQLARRLLRTPGEQRLTTLDAAIQQRALRALQDQLRGLASERVRDGAAIVVDNASGDVLAYVASAGDASRAAQIDGVRALRQAGSTLKPFLYALAIERRWLTAASLLDDSPVALAAGAGLYRPQNYEHDFQGLVSVRNALAASLNIPAVRTIVLTGVEAFRERLRALGYVDGLTESGEFYGYALALGSAEVSLYEQVNAYRTLANGGRWTPLRLVMDDTSAAADARTVIDPAAAYIVRDILADRGARALTFDLEGPLSTAYRAWVKTGTSKNLRDNWCVGGTAQHTVAVWVGNFEGDPMRTVSGVSGAAPAWREILDAITPATPPADPPPAGLVRQRVRYANDREPAREEWFIAGTQTGQIQPAAPVAARARIVSPADGTLIALDPDIPLPRQHLPLRAEPASPTLRWRLDGQPLGSAAGARLWTPIPGDHRLELLDTAEGRERVLDRVEFGVRAPRP